MAQLFEQQLARLRDRLVEMSHLAEGSLSAALEALRARDPSRADAVEAADTRIDELEVALDEMVITYMATHGPIASDCRLMLVISKINTNLERIGDLSVTVARRARELSGLPVFAPYPEIQLMGEAALGMLRDSMASFVSGEYELAPEIVRRDREVDDLKRALIERLVAVMRRDPQMVERGVLLIDVTRALERIADHAKSIAEQAYFLFRARDIRHERTA